MEDQFDARTCPPVRHRTSTQKVPLRLVSTSDLAAMIAAMLVMKPQVSLCPSQTVLIGPLPSQHHQVKSWIPSQVTQR